MGAFDNEASSLSLSEGLSVPSDSAASLLAPSLVSSADSLTDLTSTASSSLPFQGRIEQKKMSLIRSKLLCNLEDSGNYSNAWLGYLGLSKDFRYPTIKGHLQLCAHYNMHLQLILQFTFKSVFAIRTKKYSLYNYLLSTLTSNFYINVYIKPYHR